MSFGISVNRRSDRESLAAWPDVNSDEFEEWFEETSGLTLYEEPFGGDGTVFQYWSKPAAELGLPMLTEVYMHGLRAEADDLVRLRDEVVRLEEHWCTFVDLEASMTYRIGDHDLSVPLLVHLYERASYLRAAIRLAIACDGFIIVS